MRVEHRRELCHRNPVPLEGNITEASRQRRDELADWLQEAARRPRPPAPSAASVPSMPAGGAPDYHPGDRSSLAAPVRRAILLTLVLLTGLQYIYMATLLEIQLLRPLIVFVLTR